MFSFIRIANRIKANEGFRQNAYKDQLGNPTIGYGHLIRTKESFFYKKRHSKETLLKIFYIDLGKAISDFKNYFDYNNLSDNEQEVIIEMIFQLGIKKVLKFKKFFYHIQKNEHHLASLEMIKSQWYQQTPKRANKLIAILLNYDVR